MREQLDQLGHGCQRRRLLPLAAGTSTRLHCRYLHLDLRWLAELCLIPSRGSRCRSRSCCPCRHRCTSTHHSLQCTLNESSGFLCDLTQVKSYIFQTVFACSRRPHLKRCMGCEGDTQSRMTRTVAGCDGDDGALMVGCCGWSRTGL